MTAGANSRKVANQLIHWIREYADLRIDSYSIDTQCHIPPHIYFDLGNQGFFGLHISRKYNGLELDTSDMLRVIEQVAAIDLTLATIIIECVQGAHTLEKYASESMKNHYLPLLAQGRIFTAGAMTESAAGSNPRAMKSVATPNGHEGWLLNGSKRWVGMGASADIIAIYVQQVDENNHWLGMSGFLVPQGTEGLEIGPDAPTMGIRGFPKNTIHMNNIHVSKEQLLGKSGEGMEIAQDNMMYIRLCLSAASIGVMKRCIQLMYRYAERRTIATGPLIENPVLLMKLSEMTAIVDTLNNFVTLISHFLDKESASVPEELFVVAKILCSEYLGMIADYCVQTLGARGYEEASGISKIFRDARVFRIFEGPSEALNMYVGSRILEENTPLEYFICDTLKEPALFDEIKRTINQIQHHYQHHKIHSFSKPFISDYWTQALAGEVLSYGLILCSINYAMRENESKELARASLWIRNKYDSIVQNVLKTTIGEAVLLKPSQMQEIISGYTDSIGNIEQNRRPPDIFIDGLLKNNQEQDLHAMHQFIDPDLSLEKLEIDEMPDETFPLVTEAERQQLLHAWNNLENKILLPYACVHQLVEEQVLKTPKAIAVAFGDTSITYEDLNSRANKVAYFLRKKGVLNGTLVGIYMEQSIELIIALLGILKAGASYLPLDCYYPLEALQFMFEDAGASIVLSQKSWKDSIPFHTKTIVFYEDVPMAINDPILPCDMKPENTCYVIYTSGSSGKPKGVMLPHKALVNLIVWHKEKIIGKRNVLQFTSLNFDMSFLEIVAALSSGGTLTLISDQDRIDLRKFSQIIKDKKVNQLIVSMSFLKNLVSANIDKKLFRHLKEIIVAGEQITVTQDMIAFFNDCPSCRFLNYYGPSETHVVTAYEFPSKTDDWPDFPPIGKPISNTKILILNEEMQIVPIGSTGEIYIGGISLAKGYINNAMLTEERFVIDPWDNQGGKLYKTGDYGKFLPDGNIVFMGRKDHQVKLRGYRIELQEIEANLIKFPGIKEAIVIAKQDIRKDKYLEAFIVINQDNNTDEDLFDKIHAFLKTKLPSPMIPTYFHIIDKMPLTPSGKINRNALEHYKKESIKQSGRFNYIVHAATPTEKKLIHIMETFFKIRVGVNHSFTSIGGNSLLAMQIVSQIHNEFQVEIPTYSVLSDASIAETAKRIDQLLQTAPNHKNTIIARKTSNNTLFESDSY